MENPVKFRGRANVVVYENNDVDVRIPEENPDLKHEKLSESKCGKLSRTQGKQPQLLMSIKTAADSPDPAYDLRREFEKIVKVLDPKASELTKISTKLKGRWLSRSDDLKIRADTEQVIIRIDLPIGQDFELIQRLTSKITEIHSCFQKQRIARNIISKSLGVFIRVEPKYA